MVRMWHGAVVCEKCGPVDIDREVVNDDSSEYIEVVMKCPRCGEPLIGSVPGTTVETDPIVRVSLENEVVDFINSRKSSADRKPIDEIAADYKARKEVAKQFRVIDGGKGGRRGMRDFDKGKKGGFDL